MTDCERWFDELTHRYLDLIHLIHLRGVDDQIDTGEMKIMFRVLKNRRDAQALEQFSSVMYGTH